MRRRGWTVHEDGWLAVQVPTAYLVLNPVLPSGLHVTLPQSDGQTESSAMLIQNNRRILSTGEDRDETVLGTPAFPYQHEELVGTSAIASFEARVYRIVSSIHNRTRLTGSGLRTNETTT
jgi:hypothetical protein